MTQEKLLPVRELCLQSEALCIFTQCLSFIVKIRISVELPVPSYNQHLKR